MVFTVVLCGSRGNMSVFTVMLCGHPPYRIGHSVTVVEDLDSVLASN